MARWRGPGLHFCPVSWPLARDFSSPKGNLSFALSLLFSAKQESDKNEVCSCLQSILRFVGEQVVLVMKCDLRYKPCGPYLSKMHLIHWELDPGKKCMMLFVAYVFQCFIQ